MFENIGQQIKERVASPLSGAFLFSWIIVNYQFFIVLLSDVKPWVKIGFIKNQLFPDITSIIVYGFLIPLAAAVFYIFLYPYPARFALKYSLSQKREAKLAKINAEKTMPMTREDVDAEIDPLKEKIKSLQSDIDKKDTTIERLATKIERTEEKENELTRALQIKTNELAESSQTCESLRSERISEAQEIGKLQAIIKSAESANETLMLAKDAKLRSLEQERNNLKDQVSELSNNLIKARSSNPLSDTNLVNALSGYGINSFSNNQYLDTIAKMNSLQATIDKVALPQISLPSLASLQPISEQARVNRKESD